MAALSCVARSIDAGRAPALTPDQALVSRVRQRSQVQGKPVISFDNVSKTYDGQKRPALSEISFEIEKGEFVFVVGTSGSGKSTLTRLMLRELRPTTGQLQVAGRELNRLPSWKVPALRRQIGVVFQDFRLLPNKTVFENVAFALQVIGRSRNEIRETVPETLALVGLEGKETRSPDELSGGEQQRVAIARAFVNRPQILLADEPTGNLDPGTSVGHHEAARPDQPHRNHRRHGHPRRDDRRPDAQARDRTRRRQADPRPGARRVRLPALTRPTAPRGGVTCTSPPLAGDPDLHSSGDIEGHHATEIRLLRTRRRPAPQPDDDGGGGRHRLGLAGAVRGRDAHPVRGEPGQGVLVRQGPGRGVPVQRERGLAQVRR